eukprot:scaffold80797_cov43-Cyclotella_meneghiniana.AAC.6
MTKSGSLLLSATAAVLSLSNTAVTAFTYYSPNNNNHIVTSPPKSSTILHQTASRRSFFAAGGASILSSTFPLVTHAASSSTSPPTQEELNRIKTGYENIQYLLANWEKETTVCRENGGECVFNKVKYMDNVDVDKLDDFFEATEDW